MALTRTEIELLIKARNEAQGAFDSLNKQVKSVTGEADKATQSMEKTGKAAKNAGVGAQAAGVAFGLLAERLGRGLLAGFNETINAANRLDAGLIGLSSVARAFGTDAGAAQEAAKKLASDGLMSVGDAATGLKNLLAAGFGLDQAVTLMERFKDSAAFGRQGALSFGEAIRGATEGIKNGNSILVDNAGVTKNLSQMLVEAGFSAQDLSKASSDVNVRMALFNGILKETNPQLGDTAKYAETAAGKQAAFNSQIEIAQAQIGKALQPALAGLLSTLTPIAQVVGQNADTFVRLAAILATVIGPLAAIKAAAALGIPSLSSLGASAVAMGTAFQAGAVASGTLRGGLQALGVQAGLTTANLGLLGSAAAVAGAAFIGWQVGKIIDDMTGLSGVVERATKAVTGWGDASQTAGAKQDVIDRAVRQGAASTISYTDAIKFNSQAEDIRRAGWDKSAAAQAKRIDAELALGRITVEQANAQRAAIAADEQATQVRQKRVALADVLAATEKKFRDEIAATGIAQKEIVGILKSNEAGFDAWAKQVGLSDDTIKRLKDTLKGHEEAQKKSAEAVKKHQEEQKRLAEELSSKGVVSAQQAKTEFAAMERVLDAAAKIGVPALATAIRNIIPDFDALIQKAKDSGVNVDGLKTKFQDFEKAASLVIEPTRTWNDLLLTAPVATVNAESQALLATIHQEIEAQNKLNAAYDYFGIKAPSALEDAAAKATEHYQVLVAGGTASAEQLKVAYQKMIDAQKAATGELPSVWQTDVFPKISRVVETLSDAVKGSFAQMLLGAKGFKDGFVDIWESLKSAVTNILNSILSVFLDKFLKGILGAMAGQKGAFSSAFAGLFGGGGGAGGAGGGGGLLSLLGLGGGGGGGAAGAGAGAAGAGGAAAGGGGFLASGLGTVAGFAGAGLGSFFLGNLLGQKFGKVGGGIGGAAGGAGTGALIGSVVPGVGTAIGAGVGALAGLIGGLFGGGKEYGQVKEQRAGYEAQFGGSAGFIDAVSQAYAKLGKTGEEAQKALKDFWNAKDLNTYKRAVDQINAALLKAGQITQETNAALEKYGFTWEDLDQKTKQANVDAMIASMARETEVLTKAGIDQNKVLEKQADAYSELLATIVRTGTTAPASLKPILESLIAMGLLVDANGDKITDLSNVNFQETVSGLQDLASTVGEVGQRARETADDLSRISDFEPPDNIAAGGQGYPVEGGAAAGVMAKRPGLVLFGEGGETEVGGPASFFKRIFEELGLGAGGAGGPVGGGGGLVIGPFNITAMSAADVKTTIEREVIPAMIDALRVNRRGGLTDMKSVLGVS